MRVMVLIKSNKRTESGLLPGPELLKEMLRYNQELAEAGVLLAGDGLHTTSKSVRVNWDTANHITITNGPFPHPDELVAGYWLWRVDSMDEAVEWARRCPNPVGWDGVVELRPVLEVDDWGDPDAFTAVSA